MALIQYDWCAYRRRKLGHRNTQRAGCVHTQRESGCLFMSQGESLRSTQPLDTSGFLLTDLHRNNTFPLFKALPICDTLVRAALGNEYRKFPLLKHYRKATILDSYTD